MDEIIPEGWTETARGTSVYTVEPSVMWCHRCSLEVRFTTLGLRGHRMVSYIPDGQQGTRRPQIEYVEIMDGGSCPKRMRLFWLWGSRLPHQPTMPAKASMVRIEGHTWLDRANRPARGGDAL